MFHPQLLPAVIGAVLGFALIAWAMIVLVRRWGGLTQRWRWTWLVVLGLIEVGYWANIYAWFIEPNTLVVRHVEVESADWRGPPLTIVALGDTHVGGAHMNTARMERIVRRINALRPDLVVLLGDYVAGHAPEAEHSNDSKLEIMGGLAAFAGLNAPLGVVGVIGNHDSWYDRATISQGLSEAGVAALWNRNVVISRPGEDVVIAGLADDWTGDPNYAEALDGAEGRDTIVISHSPDPFAEMPPGPVLMLAAHSHCGQVMIPFIGRPARVVRHRAYECHRVEERGQVLYVTAGVGTSGPPLRFLAPPEIVVVTVRRASAETASALPTRHIRRHM